MKFEDDKILHLSQVIKKLKAPFAPSLHDYFPTCFIKIMSDEKFSIFVTNKIESNKFVIFLFDRQLWVSQRKRKEMNPFLFFWKLINKSSFWEHLLHQLFLSCPLIWYLIKSLSSPTVGKMEVSISWVTNLFFLMDILFFFPV